MPVVGRCRAPRGSWAGLGRDDGGDDRIFSGGIDCYGRLRPAVGENGGMDSPHRLRIDDQGVHRSAEPCEHGEVRDVDEPARGSMRASPGRRYSFELRPAPASGFSAPVRIDRELENLGRGNLVEALSVRSDHQRAAKSRNAGLRSQRRPSTESIA